MLKLEWVNFTFWDDHEPTGTSGRMLWLKSDLGFRLTGCILAMVNLLCQPDSVQRESWRRHILLGMSVKAFPRGKTPPGCGQAPPLTKKDRRGESKVSASTHLSFLQGCDVTSWRTAMPSGLGWTDCPSLKWKPEQTLLLQVASVKCVVMRKVAKMGSLVSIIQSLSIINLPRCSISSWPMW